jgi:hypothetical protein
MGRFGKGLKTVSSASCTGGKNKSNDVQKTKKNGKEKEKNKKEKK